MNEHYEIALARMEERIGDRPAPFSEVSLSDAHRLDDLIDDEKISLQEFLQVPHYTAQELIFYPELAKALFTRDDYPVFSMEYSVASCDATGSAFLRQLADAMDIALAQFNAECRRREEEIRSLIDRLGRRQVPVAVNSLSSSEIVINGVRYGYTRNYLDSVGGYGLKILGLHSILGISSRDADIISFNDYIPDTPYVDIRLRQTWSHKGKPNWVDLSNWQTISMSQIRRLTNKQQAGGVN